MSGQVCPDGFLPAYSVTTKKEAESLIVGACKLSYSGEYYAPELVNPLNGEPFKGRRREHHFVEFGLRLEQLHKDRIKRRAEQKNG